MQTMVVKIQILDRRILKSYDPIKKKKKKTIKISVEYFMRVRLAWNCNPR